MRGRLIAPVIEATRQRLTLLEKTADGVRRKILADVLYVSLVAAAPVDKQKLSRALDGQPG